MLRFCSYSPLVFLLIKVIKMIKWTNSSSWFLTCFRLHREIGLPLKYAVNDSGAVPVWRVIGICSCDLHHRSTWSIQIQLSSAQYQKEEQKHWFSLKTWMISGFNNDLLKKLSYMIWMNMYIHCVITGKLWVQIHNIYLVNMSVFMHAINNSSVSEYNKYSHFTNARVGYWNSFSHNRFVLRKGHI